MHLDLGGTQEGDVSISLDGTHINDESEYAENVRVTDIPYPIPRLIGDYFRCPFPNNTFDSASGCCVLEENEWKDILFPNYTQFYKEMHRVLKNGGKLWVRGCGNYHQNHTAHAAGSGMLLSEFGENDSNCGSELEYDEGLTFINTKPWR